MPKTHPLKPSQAHEQPHVDNLTVAGKGDELYDYAIVERSKLQVIQGKANPRGGSATILAQSNKCYGKPEHLY